MKRKGYTSARAREQSPMVFEVALEEEIKLLDYLLLHALKDRSRTTVKQLLHDRFISVNEEATTQFDLPLRKGDVVVLHAAPLPKTLHHPQVDILWQDDDLIMIHKMRGVPTVASGEERDRTLMQIVSEHLKKFNPRAKVFLLNRIDKDCAGFVLMAKSEALQAEMTERWEEYVAHQTFVVAIEGHLPEAEGYLAAPESKDTAKGKGKQSSKRVQGYETAGQAHYRTASKTAEGSVVIVELKKGRNNRLRRQFAALSRPIVGDWRNGSKLKKMGFVALDTLSFSFVHPKTGKTYTFDQEIPSEVRGSLRLLKRQALQQRTDTAVTNRQSK